MLQVFDVYALVGTGELSSRKKYICVTLKKDHVTWIIPNVWSMETEQRSAYVIQATPVQKPVYFNFRQISYERQCSDQRDNSVIPTQRRICLLLHLKNLIIFNTYVSHFLQEWIAQ